MNRGLGWVLVGVVLVAGAAGWLLLSGDDGPADEGAGRSLTADHESPTTPRFDDPAPETAPDRLAPEPMDSEPRDPEPIEPPPRRGAPDATTFGPAASGETRRVTGQVRRLADGSPLEFFQVLPVTAAGAGDLQPLDWDPVLPLADDRTAWMARASRAARDDVTDDEGRFALAAVPVEAEVLRVANHHVLASFRDRSPRKMLVDLPTGADDVEDLDVLFDTGWIAVGSVRDAYGVPVAHARLKAAFLVGEARTPAGEQIVIGAGGDLLDLRPVIATSDEDGAYRVPDLAVPAQHGSLADDGDVSGTCRIEVVAPGFVYASKDLEAPDRAVVVGPVDFALERAGGLSGFARDRRGVPATGARVKVEWAMGDDHGRRPEAPDEGLVAQVDAEGFYRIGNVPPGRFVVGALAAGDEPWNGGRPGPWVADVVVEAGRDTRLDFVLGGGAVLAGRVADTSGNPVAGVRVELVRAIAWDAPANRGSTGSSHREGAHWAEVRTHPSATGASRTVLRTLEDAVETGPDGTYRFEAVSAGAKQLRTLGRKGERVLPVRHEVELLGHEILDGFDFVLGGGRTLRGRVTDRRGIPLEGVKVVVRQQDIQVWSLDEAVTTDEHGRFEVSGLPDTPLRVWLHSPRHTDRWEDLAPDQHDLEVALEPAHFLRGSVVEAGSGAPVRHFSLEIESASALFGQNVDDAKGAFELAVLSNAACTLRVSAPGFVPLTLGDVRPDDTALQPLRIVLPREP